MTDTSETIATAAKPQSRAELVLSLLLRPKGATIEQLVAGVWGYNDVKEPLRMQQAETV
jgi:hypothetical protein